MTSSPPTTAPADADARWPGPGSLRADDPVGHTTAFFTSLLDDAPTDHHALLWTMPGKKSTWVPLRHGIAGGPDAITEQAQLLSANGKDVYVAVSVAAQPGLHDTRIESANSAGIFGLWADIDVADPDVHKKWNLPPTIDAALELLDAAQLEPTLIVHSGHGLQAWWLFKEFWRFETKDVRLEAAGLAQRWNDTLRVRAAERSWVVDSTFDLARVMRVPGTLNRKGSPVMPVRLLRTDGPRYDPSEVEPFCVDASYLAQRGLTPARSYVPDDFEVSEANKLDYELLQALLDNDEQFKLTWDMKRSTRDFPDQSPSSYDMSLATLAARAGWSDAAIGALIFAFRKRHKLDTSKALRKDYIVRTLARARDGLARDDGAEVLDEVGDALEEAKRTGDPDAERDARRAVLDTIGQQLGMEILHFIKYLSEPAAFAVVTPVRTISLGDRDGILSWAKFKGSVWESVGISIPRMKTPAWDQITELIPKAWEEQDVGDEATERGEVAAWLGAYLSQRPPVETLEEAASSEYPFVEADADRVTLFGPAFRRWIYLTYQERVTNKELGRRLRAFGCEPDKVNVEDKATGKRTSRGVWRLPKGLGV